MGGGGSVPLADEAAGRDDTIPRIAGPSRTARDLRIRSNLEREVSDGAFLKETAVGARSGLGLGEGKGR